MAHLEHAFPASDSAGRVKPGALLSCHPLATPVHGTRNSTSAPLLSLMRSRTDDGGAWSCRRKANGRALA
eukprot:scaffold15024_cov124-Isochrysis_galbana.AAC.5